MKYFKNKKQYKAFTLIELVVVMAIIGILVLLATPKFMGYITRANDTKAIANTKVLEDAIELYYVDNDEWPKIADTTYTADEVTAMAASVVDKAGNPATLDPAGSYYLIDYDVLKNYISKPDNADKYVLQNPVGSVYYLSSNSNSNDENQYTLATDADFTKIDSASAPNSSYYYQYTGTAEYVEVPTIIQGDTITDTFMMFANNLTVKGVKINNPNVTNMKRMFYQTQSTSLDLSNFNTSNVSNMSDMFYNSKITSLDLSSFNTSNVTDMSYMFAYSKATSLNLSNFNTSKVTDMSYMFSGSTVTSLDLSNFDTSNVVDMRYMFIYSAATSLDLSNFNTSNVTYMSGMFQTSKATILDLSSFEMSGVTYQVNMLTGAAATTGYAKDASNTTILNSIANKPAGLTFTVK